MPSTECHVCGKEVQLSGAGKKYRVHNDPITGGKCDAAGTFLPGPSGTPGAVENVPLPDVDPYIEELGKAVENLAEQQLAAYRETVAHATPFAQPAAPAEQPALPAFSQPSTPQRRTSEAQPMTDLGAEIAARLKEMFFNYGNRRDEGNRSAQQTLGPSEIGTPCDRRLAMSLLRIPPVNPGGDGWAAFVGTCVHVGLADMLTWANADTGRYAVEVPLTFPSAYVPRGTGDLLDRVLLLFSDHKAMGKWSLNKLKSKGPLDTYRVQVQIYAYGARQRGEKVEHVAIIGWPRDQPTLEDLYVWTEPYDPKIARDALERVDRIAKVVESKRSAIAEMDPQTMSDSDVAGSFPIADDCRYCPYHLPGANSLEGGGCNGKQ